MTTPLLDLPKSRAEIERIQSERKRHALAQARRAPFYDGKLDHVIAERLDDPDEWRKIPILDKDTLRKLDDRRSSTKSSACTPDDGIAEYWRSGGATGAAAVLSAQLSTTSKPRMIGFARIYDCARCRRGGRAHVSFPLGIHPVGQMLARAAATRGIAVNWAGLRHHHAVGDAARADRAAEAHHLDGHEQLRPASRQSRRGAPGTSPGCALRPSFVSCMTVERCARQTGDSRWRTPALSPSSSATRPASGTIATSTGTR